EASALVGKSGLRWTELLRLPYYKASTYLVVDVMHNLFLGLIKEHFQNILGYDPDNKKRKTKKGAPAKLTVVNFHYNEANPEPDSETEPKVFNDVYTFCRWLQRPIDFSAEGPAFDKAVKRWRNLRKEALIRMATGLGIQLSLGDKGTREDYARAILLW
ncbi:hypothetical protein C0989_011767, partial [Termitomyces sp. Mn162]